MSSGSTVEAAESWKSGDKRHFVMAHALELLIEAGYQGLTMRGLADRCGMSLSNVQYYFRTKDDLTAEIAERYFGECDSILSSYFEINGPVATRDALQDLVALFLDHGREMTDMCRIFRELWAVGSRNEDVAELLNRHYRRLGERLSSHLKYPSASPETAERTASLIIVISEGYSIVADAQPLEHDEAVALFTDILVNAADHV